MEMEELFRDLDKWQACSRGDLAIRKPQELFAPDFA
jgi:hypothetical protein